ncbi:MAG: hypothetical protein LQ337_000913 [Flavoplaca oasis]|nr:MAG: hypothetical protein LQ337_000913 [Flavoplaca oasis]
MSYAHDDKENRPPPQSHYESVFQWTPKPLTARKQSSRQGAKTISPGPFSPSPGPTVGTFSTRIAPEQQLVGIWTPLPQVHMPYNNAAIPPSEEITGSASLPLARVKRILALDEDINQCSNNGAFVLTVATEMFIRYLAEQALNVVKSERKPRRNIQYKDLGISLPGMDHQLSLMIPIANAVARIDNLEFLTDVIPKTTTFREYKEKKSKFTKVNASLSTGQTTLDGPRQLPSRPADVTNLGEEQTDLNHLSQDETLEEHIAGNGRIEQSGNYQGIVPVHYKPDPQPRPDESEDVEMG